MIPCSVRTQISKQDGPLLIGSIVSEEDVSHIASTHPIYGKQFTYLNFSGKAGQVARVVDGDTVVIFVGIGTSDDQLIDDRLYTYRNAIGLLYRAAESVAIDVLHIDTRTNSRPPVSPHLQEIAIIAQIASYRFTTYQTGSDETKNSKKSVILVVDEAFETDAKSIITSACIIGSAVNKARYWVDLPPSDLTPPQLAEQGELIAADHGLRYTVFNEQEINDMGMGGIAAVSRGSEVDCRLMILEYEPAEYDNSSMPTVALVGKGITFDSGGLSLKPAKYMETMKEDMSGAAAVIATMEAIAQLKPAVRVIGVTPLAENLPSGKAVKPGDIIRFYNGKTAEVRNTDAEGRLILADALAYTVEQYKPDIIADIATLTGACAYALGPIYTGLFTENESVVRPLIEIGKRSGDLLWQLPMGTRYRNAIKSTVADICNIGNESIRAGGTTAAHFLQHFVGDSQWFHLDIAGTAFDVPDISYYHKGGATGVGVRLFIEMIKDAQFMSLITKNRMQAQ